MAAHGDETGMVRVGDYLIERLRAHGVDHVFDHHLLTSRWAHRGGVVDAVAQRRRCHPDVGSFDQPA